MRSPRPTARAWWPPLALAALVSGCQSDPEPVPDERPAAVEPDAEETSEPSAPAAGPDGGPAAAAGALYDQLIVKVKATAPALAKGDPGGFAEDATGAEVVEVRPGPLGVKLLVFAPTDPPRTAADRDRLMAALEETRAFEYVEPNRLYQAK